MSSPTGSGTKRGSDTGTKLGESLRTDVGTSSDDADDAPEPSAEAGIEASPVSTAVDEPSVSAGGREDTGASAHPIPRLTGQIASHP